MINKNFKKHNSVPIKQWSNVNYSYNKNNEKYLLYKNNYNKILNSYFNLTKKVKSFKSKRMRNLIKRFSTIKLFNSDGGIKQNSDKINFTIYTFDKEKSTQLKTLYDLNKSLTKINRYNIYRLRNINNIRNIINIRNNLKTKNFTNLSTITNKNLSLKNLVNAFFIDNKVANTKYKKLNKKIANKSKIFNNLNLSNTIKNDKLKNFDLTKVNNTLFNNLYKKNINYYNKKLSIPKNIKKWTSAYKRERISLIKNKKIMLQNKRNLLYKKLINNLSWSFKNKKVILYKTMYLRLFYMYILESLGISLIIKKQQNSFALFCNSDIYKWNNLLVDKLPDKFSLIKNINKLYKLISEKLRNKLVSNYSLKYKVVSKKPIKSRYVRNIINKKISRIISNLKLERILWINNKLEKVVNIGLNVATKNNNSDMIKKVLYKEFKKNNIDIIFNYFFEKQSMIIENVYNSFINNNKYTNLSNILKYGLNKLYNKKIFLNIVNLKYLHMSADIFINAIIIKLRNRNNNILKTIKRSMKLAKLGKLNDTLLEQPLSSDYIHKGERKVNFPNLVNEMYNLSDEDENYVNITNVKQNYEIINNSYIDINDNISSFIVKTDKNSKTFKNKTREILKNLRHKWITGVRLESKGRLSKRFTSSRSMFKYKTKGNLRNKLGFSNEDFLKLIKKGNKVYKESPSIILSRGIKIPNIQYVKKTGVRRVGSFGVKLWINND